MGTFLSDSGVRVRANPRVMVRANPRVRVRQTLTLTLTRPECA